MRKRLPKRFLWLLLPLALALAVPFLGLPGNREATAQQSLQVSPANESGIFQTADEESFSLVGVAVDLVVKLALVIGLAYLSIKLWKRALVKRSPLPHGRNLINILEFSHLGHNQTLCLVRVGEKVLLVGATAAQVSLVSEVSDAVAAQVREEAESGAASFADYMKLADLKLGTGSWAAMLRSILDYIKKAVGFGRTGA